MKLDIRKLAAVGLGLGLLAAGCSPRTAAAPAGGAAAPAAHEPKLFSQAVECAACHGALKDAAGASFSFNTAWQRSMHASAGIDPYYLATVRSEVNQYSDLKAAVENTCSTCHLPMANRTAQAEGQAPAMFDGGAVDAANPLHGMLQEGVSCTVCHQIQANGLGTAAGNTGNFLIDLKTPAGQRDLFGPFAISEASAKMMQPLGYQVKQSAHMQTSEFCAICHTLYTSPIGKDGKKSEIRFTEQAPYLEWQQSAFKETNTCQSCHMPALDGAAKISSVGTPERSPVNQHSFTGGNTIMLKMIEQNGKTLGSSAPGAALEASMQRTQALLHEKTAGLAVETQEADGALKIQVTVTNQAGHKLPTAFPSRRAWLHVTVKDDKGQTVFESGAWKPDGQIVGNDNDENAARFEAHHDLITSSDEVQIYESILGDLDGQVTTGVIKAASYLKDNRLLPDGFDKSKATPETAVSQDALQDENFTGGQDQVTYQTALQGGGAYTVTVELLYQSIGYRWMQNIAGEESQESQMLRKMADESGLTPEVLATQQVAVPAAP
jgi:hypothetical protein